MLTHPLEFGVGDTDDVIEGGVVYVNAMPLLAVPPTCTTRLPELSPAGKVTPRIPCAQLFAVPTDTPLRVTVLLPWLAPKLSPLTWT
jgi:hypothetical protein